MRNQAIRPSGHQEDFFFAAPERRAVAFFFGFLVAFFLPDFFFVFASDSRKMASQPVANFSDDPV